MRPRRTIGRWAGPLVAVVVALAGGGIAAARHPAPPPAAAVADPAPVAVTSEGPTAVTLEELAAASTVVVRGRVVATEPGRTFGTPGGPAVRSRFVTVAVGEVLRGPTRVGDRLLVEQPGWLADGTPLVVDGVAPTEVGDEVLWFLVATPEVDGGAAAATPAWVAVGPQGQLVVHGDRLTGPAGSDPLVARLEALGLAGVRAALGGVAAAPSSTP